MRGEGYSDGERDDALILEILTMFMLMLANAMAALPGPSTGPILSPPTCASLEYTETNIVYNELVVIGGKLYSCDGSVTETQECGGGRYFPAAPDTPEEQCGCTTEVDADYYDCEPINTPF